MQRSVKSDLEKQIEKVPSGGIDSSQGRGNQEKLALLGQTAAFLAHEIRNPLGALRLYLSLLSEKISEDEPYYELLGKMNRNIEGLNQIVGNVLQFSRESKASDALYNIESLAKECVLETNDLMVPPGVVTLSVECDPFLQGTEQSIRQVVRNLLLNAAHATDFRGEISLTIRQERREAEGIRCEVSDNGEGIPEEIMSEMFSPFATTKTHGTGLGLAVVSQLIDLHKGAYGAFNQQSGGAIVWFWLPRSPFLL